MIKKILILIVLAGLGYVGYRVWTNLSEREKDTVSSKFDKAVDKAQDLLDKTADELTGKAKKAIDEMGGSDKKAAKRPPAEPEATAEDKPED
ncbi:MAG: hypothetical protein JXR96_10985 [Deltaproteobacteria bacterium]|nr:hypothetical protein [Deltaproteobacteria bacterium]